MFLMYAKDLMTSINSITVVHRHGNSGISSRVKEVLLLHSVEFTSPRHLPSPRTVPPPDICPPSI